MKSHVFLMYLTRHEQTNFFFFLSLLFHHLCWCQTLPHAAYSNIPFFSHIQSAFSIEALPPEVHRRYQIVGRLTSKGDTAQLSGHFISVQWCLFWFNIHICHLHPPLWLWHMHPACWPRKKDRFWSQVPEETSLRLLLSAQDQPLHAGQDQLPRGSTGTSSGKRQKLVWFGLITCHDSLSNTILQGILEGGRCHGWQRKC